MINRWRPPHYINIASKSRHERIRKKWHILTEGENLPPPIKTFKVSHTLQKDTVYYIHVVQDIMNLS